MDNPIPTKERRDYKRPKDVAGVVVLAAVIFLLSALVYFITTVFHLTDVAQASEGLRYDQVHTEHEACVWLKAHPGHIKNVTWCDL